MDKVKIDIEVVNGIINAYNRSKNQTRIFGIILGTKKNNIYHICDVLYGFIFEEGEDKKTQKKTYVRLNEDNLNSILKSYTHKFNVISQPKINEKLSKDKDISFLSYDNLMILGGFATDKELFNDLHQLYTTIEQINNKTFKILNSLLLLVDPNNKDDDALKYGIKTFIWEIKSIKIKKEVKRLLTFSQIENEVIQNLNAVNLLNSIFNEKNPYIKLYNLDIDKNEKKTTSQLLFSSDDKNKEEIKVEDNEKKSALYFKNKVKQSLDCLEVIEKFLEENINKNGTDSKDNESEVLDQIATMVSKLEPILNSDEILSKLSNEIHKNDNVNSLVNLLQVQLNLSDRIHTLIN